MRDGSDTEADEPDAAASRAARLFDAVVALARANARLVALSQTIVDLVDAADDPPANTDSP